MNKLDGTSITIVGSGIGGLANACYLAKAGADVTVLEKNEQPGGRVSRLYRDGFTFDMGPSWYLMPDAFDRFFDHFNHTTDDFYDLTHLDPHYSIHFTDGDYVEISGDIDKLAGLFEYYEDGAGEQFHDYLTESKHTYEIGMEHFVYTDRSRLRDWLDPSILWKARGLDVRNNMQHHVDQYFDHPKLQQIIQYSLLFLGGSPKTTPALYSLMSHLDFNLGVWYPDGGLGSVVDALVEIGDNLGVDYYVNAEVKNIRGRRGAFIVDVEQTNQNGESPLSEVSDNPPTAIAVPNDGPPESTSNHESGSAEVMSDLVVLNTDLTHAEQELLPPEKSAYGEDYWDSRTYSPAAFVMYLGVEGDLPELSHHSLIMPVDWSEHFESIFDDPSWPDNPSYYICVPSKTDDSVAPDGHHNIVALVPIAPGIEDNSTIREGFRDQLIDALAEHANTDIQDRIVVEESFCISDFVGRYNSNQGSALGIAHTKMQTAMFRPNHRYPGVSGLYATGGNTNPGAGVPMCLISGEITADKIISDIA
ncbi:phytoene desaturase [Salinarchaeum sp. IM2453]|uniref:phytoene desaturase family protein n=1 Tax=Salinarchaeum sp. IM2453 TaxID=2862870 RepID=UPI001C82A242|nr:phytoene desaturase family protein [Salinarchaeum sp. IM2453]QZA87425.1 phytoene desaturase [Salinarchaeum sp. IM2453]